MKIYELDTSHILVRGGRLLNSKGIVLSAVRCEPHTVRNRLLKIAFQSLEGLSMSHRGREQGARTSMQAAEKRD